MYTIESPAQKALDGLGMASNTYSKMMKDIPANRDPGPTTGGALMNGLSGAAMGASLGNLTGATAAGVSATGAAIPATAGALGLGLGAMTGIGAAIGIGAYLLS